MYNNTIISSNNTQNSAFPVDNFDLIEMPDELTLNVFKFFTPKQLTKINLVCRKWQQLSNENFLWNELCLKTFSIKAKIYNETIKQTFIRCTSGKQWVKFQEFVAPCSNIIELLKKDNFLICFSVTLSCNKYNIWDVCSKSDIWDMNTARLVKCISFRSYCVWKCLVHKSTLIVLNSRSPIVAFININDFSIMKEIDASDKGSISCYFKSQSELILGYDNGLIRVFDLNTFELTNEFKGHNGQIHCILVTDNFLITSAQNEQQIKVWDLHTKQHAFTLVSCVSILHSFGNKLICSRGCGKIFSWDLNTHQRRTLVEQYSSRLLLQIHNGKLISCGDDTINMHDLETGQNTLFKFGYKNYGQFMEMSISEDELFVWGHLGKILIFDLNNLQQPKQIIDSGHVFLYDNKKLITRGYGYDRGKISVYVKNNE